MLYFVRPACFFFFFFLDHSFHIHPPDLLFSTSPPHIHHVMRVSELFTRYHPTFFSFLVIYFLFFPFLSLIFFVCFVVFRFKKKNFFLVITIFTPVKSKVRIKKKNLSWCTTAVVLIFDNNNHISFRGLEKSLFNVQECFIIFITFIHHHFIYLFSIFFFLKKLDLISLYQKSVHSS